MEGSSSPVFRRKLKGDLFHTYTKVSNIPTMMRNIVVTQGIANALGDISIETVSFQKVVVKSDTRLAVVSVDVNEKYTVKVPNSSHDFDVYEPESLDDLSKSKVVEKHKSAIYGGADENEVYFRETGMSRHRNLVLSAILDLITGASDMTRMNIIRDEDGDFHRFDYDFISLSSRPEKPYLRGEMTIKDKVFVEYRYSLASILVELSTIYLKETVAVLKRDGDDIAAALCVDRIMSDINHKLSITKTICPEDTTQEWRLSKAEVSTLRWRINVVKAVLRSGEGDFLKILTTLYPNEAKLLREPETAFWKTMTIECGIKVGKRFKDSVRNRRRSSDITSYLSAL